MDNFNLGIVFLLKINIGFNIGSTYSTCADLNTEVDMKFELDLYIASICSPECTVFLTAW